MAEIRASSSAGSAAEKADHHRPGSGLQSGLDEGESVVWAPQAGPQTLLVQCPIEDLLYGGARGGGKTDGLLGDWLHHEDRWKKFARGILFRRTYDELDDVIARSQEIFQLVGARYKSQKRTWHFPSGAILKLRYLKRDEDASLYQGHSYTWAGIDEAGNFPSPDPIDKIFGTLRSKHGVPCVMRKSANPGGVGHLWLKKRYIDPALPFVPFTDPTTGIRRVFIPSGLADNPLLLENDPNYVTRLKASGPAWLVQAWLAGDWNATPEGGIVKAEWFQRYRSVHVDRLMLVQSWDTAYKDKQINDYSVCSTWIITRLHVYLIHVYRQKLTYPGLKRAVKSMAGRFSPDAVLIEDKASGQSLIQELRDTTHLPVIPILPVTDKVTRMNATALQFESGRVKLPESAPWLLDYEIELTTFPNAANDDQVDSTSQFLDWSKKHGRPMIWDSAGETTAGESGKIQTSVGYGSVGSSETYDGF